MSNDLTWPSAERLFREIPLVHIRSRQTRYTEDDLKGLSESIGIIGLLNPITVVPRAEEDRYEVVAGAGRLAAAKAKGHKTIWCAIVPHTATSAAAELIYLHENIHRLPLTDFEHDVALTRMLRLTQELNEERTTAAAQRRAAAAGVKGAESGKLGGRGKKKKNPPRQTLPQGVSATKEARASEREGEHGTAFVARQAGIAPRTVRVAAQRSEQAARSVLTAYGESKLTRQQVTLFSRLEKPEQEEILPAVLAAKEGKATGIIEARVMAHHKQDQSMRVLLRDLGRLDRIVDKLPNIARSIISCVVDHHHHPTGTARFRSKLLALIVLFQEVIECLTPHNEEKEC